MRGYVEEAPEVRALSMLRKAARRYSAKYLDDLFQLDDTEERLKAAAMAYAEAVRPYPKPKKRKKKT